MPAKSIGNFAHFRSKRVNATEPGEVLSNRRNRKLRWARRDGGPTLPRWRGKRQGCSEFKRFGTAFTKSEPDPAKMAPDRREAGLDRSAAFPRMGLVR
jgi:hypothetical protein